MTSFKYAVQLRPARTEHRGPGKLRADVVESLYHRLIGQPPTCLMVPVLVRSALLSLGNDQGGMFLLWMLDS